MILFLEFGDGLKCTFLLGKLFLIRWWQLWKIAHAQGVEGLELAQGHIAKGLQTEGLCHTLGDENGVVAFHIGKDEQLLDGGIVAHITFLAWVGFSPFACCTAEEGDIGFAEPAVARDCLSKLRHSARLSSLEQVGFIGIDEVFLFGGEFWRNKVLLYGIRMDTIVKFGDFAIEVP